MKITLTQVLTMKVRSICCSMLGIMLLCTVSGTPHHRHRLKYDIQPELLKCIKCKPGYYALQLCNESRDTVCKPCLKGQYTSSHNLHRQCSVCSQCGAGLFQLKKCTQFNDVFCASCSSSSAVDTTEYQIKCPPWHNTDYQRDAASERSKEIVEGSGDIKNPGVEIPIFSKVDSKESQKSKVKIYKILAKSDYNVLDIDSGSGDDELLEGSGVIDIDTPGFVLKYDNVPTISDDDVIEDELIPFSSSVSPKFLDENKDTESTSAADFTILLGSGFTLDSYHPEGNSSTSIIKELVTGTTEDSRQLPIDTENEDTLDEIVIVALDDIVDVTLAATAKHDEATDGGSPPAVSKTTLIVSILVTAVSCFIIGYLASRFVSRRKARNRNKKSSNTLNGIHTPLQPSKGSKAAGMVEYRDPGPGRGTGIYDEVDMSDAADFKPDSGLVSQKTTGANHDSSNDLYATPNKKSTAVKVPVADLEEIKFIDDSGNEEEDESPPTSRLLKDHLKADDSKALNLSENLLKKLDKSLSISEDDSYL